MHRTALHPTIALPLAAIMLALALSASVAASESDPDAPPPAPTPTGTSTPLRPDAAPPADEIAGANAAASRVYLPLVVRPEPYPPVNRQWELEFIRLLNEC